MWKLVVFVYKREVIWLDNLFPNGLAVSCELLLDWSTVGRARVLAHMRLAGGPYSARPSHMTHPLLRLPSPPSALIIMSQRSALHHDAAS